MAVSLLDPATEKLLSLLSSLPSAQLATAVSQYAGLSKHIADALRVLAAASLQQGSSYSSSTGSSAKIIADLMRKLVARGDPSLVKKLLPNHSPMIDLAICTDAKDLCARLLDETSAMECIQAAAMVFETACNASKGLSDKDEDTQRIDRAAMCLASVTSSMPRRKVVEERGSTSLLRQKAKDDSAALLLGWLRQVSEVYGNITKVQAGLVGQNLTILRCKVSLLDASWSLAERILVSKQGPQGRSDGVLSALYDDAVNGRMGGTPLLDVPLIVDLAMVRPQLVRLIKSNLSPTSMASMKVIEEHVTAFDNTEAPFASPLWAKLSSSISAEASGNAEQIESILAILPHLASDRAKLEHRLKGPRYHGKELESIIQLLLEEEDDADEAAGGHIMMEEEEEDGPMRILRERANVFNDEPLQAVAVTRGKARDGVGKPFELSDSLSNDIRAAILARAELPDSDEEEEWNPFYDHAYEAGFEEEIEPPRVSKVKEAYADEISDDEEGEGDEEEAEAESTQPEGRGEKAAASLTSVAAERAAERVLISAWSERGEQLFSKDARKSSARSELKTSLNKLPGKRWDDGLIESWASMFARNPQKDRLLASVDDIMRVGNTNLIEGAQDSFGPNRGRGGRIMNDAGGSGSHRGGGRGGRGRGGTRGRGRGRGRGHK